MTDSAPRRPLWLRVLALVICLALVASFIALGTWQMQRLAWKNGLIAAVQARAYGDPVPLPAASSEQDHAYLRVQVSGTPAQTQLKVKALTDLGPGHWIMSPLETDAGVLWVNRGFVPTRAVNLTDMPDRIEGLLRPTEPDGTFLERNDPDANRWVSRDTHAMSAALGLGDTLPYFIDADHIGPAPAWPRGGMTILKFRNTHLSYALTWYAMAALLLGALGAIVWRRGKTAQP